MSVLQKLNKARTQFHSSRIEKTGNNKFAGYKYFELADFLVPALKIFDELGLCSVISFTADLATMTITDIEDNTSVVITSPMSSAALKACHEVQNLGAVQTYLRRYLWVAALEIVEHDAVDSSDGPEAATNYRAIAAGLEQIAPNDPANASKLFYSYEDKAKNEVWQLLSDETRADIRRNKPK